MTDLKEERPATDWLMFALTFGVILLACVPVFGLGHEAAGTITAAYDALTQRFGVVYLWYQEKGDAIFYEEDPET